MARQSGIEVDFDGSFKRALKTLAEKHRMSSAQVVNQTLLDIAEKSFELTPAALSKDVRSELRQVIADRQFLGQKTAAGTDRLAQTKEEGLAGRITKAGKFIRKGKLKQLQAINLIANYWRGRKGKKGLYGDAMRRYAGKVVQSRTGGSGSLKIAFLPAMRTIMPFARFKFSWSAKAKGIKRWPGSSGWGSASPAKKGTSPEAVFSLRRIVRAGQDAKVTAIYKHVVSAAIQWKRANVIRKAEQILQPTLDEFNRR